jgi:hypothetical protein
MEIINSSKVAVSRRRAETQRAMTDKLKYAISAIRRISGSVPHLPDIVADPRVEKIVEALEDLAIGLEGEIASIEEKINKKP